MFHKVSMFAAAVMVVGAGLASAQEHAGAGRVEINAMPFGGMIFTQSANAAEPKFSNVVFGGSVTGNANRWIGVEGNFAYAMGRAQDLTFQGNALTAQKTPSLLQYDASVVYNPGGSDHAVVPYLAGGIGALTMLNTVDTANLGVTANKTFLSSSIGGGARWFSNRHWGLRGDYRLLAIKSDLTAPAFFGQSETRFAHRVSGSLVLTY